MVGIGKQKIPKDIKNQRKKIQEYNIFIKNNLVKSLKCIFFKPFNCFI